MKIKIFLIAASIAITTLQSTNATASSCNLDADCTGNNWCNEASHSCTPKLANGSPIPSDPLHTSPVLNGVCTSAAAFLVCVSGVCDSSDNICGYANTDGPCTIADGATVCRSGACSVNGTCEPPGGCNLDADCPGNNWCNEASHSCTPKLANGSPIPSDPLHTSPVLNGVCTSAAAFLVCVSGVCDSSDNICGYANTDGPCTIADGATVCRSGACSVNGTCEQSGGCNLDADCPGNNWCNEASHSCTPKLANGSPIPSDPLHTSPVLNGVCTSAAAFLVCVSGVCDSSDNICGYANTDGPCTIANGPTVCRSGSCSVNGTCEPPGGCNLDADCPGSNWCNEASHSCTPKLANGSPIPSDPLHTSPVLNGVCTSAAAFLVCVSGVCDSSDNICGYANNDGPCTIANGPTVCRSGSCSVNGTCEPPGGCNPVNPPFKIAGGSMFNDPSIELAYDSMQSAETLEIQSESFTENTSLLQNISVIMLGGFSCDFSSNPGFTTIHGSLTIGDGTVTVGNFIIQ